MQLILVENGESTPLDTVTEAAAGSEASSDTNATQATTAADGDPATTTTRPNNLGGGNEWITIVLMVAMIAVMYFVMIRPQRKRQKEEQKMRNSLRVGDEITTIGGICGRILQVKDDSLVIETGADRSKMTIKKWAIQSCDTVRDPADIDDDDDDDDDI